MNAQTLAVAAIAERIKPLLAGHPPGVQGAVLAELLALWLAGHHVAGDREATREMRAVILAAHLQGMEPLIAVNAEILGTTP
jgi:hypothetical protein